MGYWEYVYISGQWFWQHWSVTLLLSLFEGGLFLWLTEPLGEKHNGKWASSGEKLVFLGLCVLIQLRHLPVVSHCLAFMALWAGYLLLTHWVDLGQALFFSGIFCLTSELVKLLLKDGVVAGIIAYLIPGLPGGVLNGIILVCYLGVLGRLTFFIRRQILNQLRPGFGPNGVQSLGLLLPLILHLLVRSLQFEYMGTDSYLWLRLQLIQIANAFCALVLVLTTQRSLAAVRERNEHLKGEMLLREQQRQYLVRKETIDAVNRKYHDLKHYLAGIEALSAGGGATGEEVQGYVKAMGREIEPYEQFLDTGSEMLDILLPERIRQCQEKDIRLIPLVDGRRLGFINSLDLCAMFGNAMDNAIEAVQGLKEPELREIHARLGVSQGLAMLCFRNYFDGQVKKQGERLLTRKENTGDHGYGLENIRRIAERYGGTAAWEIQGQEFSLNILIPVPPEEKTAE
ncbi:MAG: sensor histidine kinase [Oscillospiraceae bacterium]|nr:sensor histidine kinase [Oscillospiraceae bacterium]